MFYKRIFISVDWTDFEVKMFLIIGIHVPIKIIFPCDYRVGP